MVISTDFDILNYKFKKERKLKKILIVFCAILGITAIILIINYIILENKFISKNLCENDLCIRSAASLRLAMNMSVDPCENFYSFVCGRWSSEHPDHGWFSPVSAFSIAQEAITIATLKFLHTKEAKNEPLPVTQSRVLYKSCMNIEAANKLGFKPIFKYLSLVGLPAIPTYMNFTKNNYSKTNKFNWIRTDALITRLIGYQAFIGFSVDLNHTNTSQYCMNIGVPALINYPLPSKLKSKKYNFYKHFVNLRNNSKDVEDANQTKLIDKKRREIFYYIIYTVTAANLTNSKLPANFSKVVNKTVDMMLELRETIYGIKYYEDQSENDTNSSNSTDCHAMTITVNELQNQTNILFKSLNMTRVEIWKPYLQQIFEGINVSLDFNNEAINVNRCSLEYLLKIVTYLCNMPDELIELWSWWQIVQRFVFHTTWHMRNYGNDLSLPTFDEPVQFKCVDVINNYMGMAVSYAIADKIVLKDTRQKVEDMIIDIKMAFTERIKRIKWMDEETKLLTLEKCKEMLSWVGYPEWLTKPGALQKFYSNITMNSNKYLDNLVALTQRNIKMDLEKLHIRHDRNWPEDTFPITVNAFHVPNDNSIIVPMAFLFFPLYNLGLEVLNYAATGCTLGHELIHGFDNTGRQFDKYGNYIQWWDKEVIEKFEKLAQCFVEQYNTFYVPEASIYVNGEVSLGENIADNDGLRLAYMAYRKFKVRNKKEQKLPGLEQYTQDQIFFIAYASTWCDVIEEDNKAYIDEEPHPPKMYRLIGSIQNSEEFARAFHCKKGTKMNPDQEKCSIW